MQVSSSRDKFTSKGSSLKPKLNPWFVTGIIDAEGTFCTTIYKNKAYKTGWVVRSFFEIGLNQRDSSLIYQLKDFFEGIGTISLDKKANVLKYSTASLKDLSSVVIPHFKKYPLLSQKGADFLNFEQIVELILCFCNQRQKE